MKLRSKSTLPSDPFFPPQYVPQTRAKLYHERCNPVSFLDSTKRVPRLLYTDMLELLRR